MDGSGWTDALMKAGISRSGVVESSLHVSHLKRTRYSHEVTAVVLYHLLVEAYELSNDEYCDITQYISHMSSKYPLFSFWYTTLKLEIIILAFVRSQRQGNFDLYITTMKELMPWMFALDHTNYKRWLPVHIADLTKLDSTCPDLAAEFKKGKFVVQKTCNIFSSFKCLSRSSS